MKPFKLLLITLLAIAIGACGGAATEQKADEKADKTASEKKDDAATKDDTEKSDAADGSPKEAITEFLKAYEAKDVEGVKKRLSSKALAGMEEEGKKDGKSVDDMLKKFIELPLPFKGVPEMRNEKIEGDKATIEIKAEGDWEKTPLIKEDGMWKLAFEEAN